MNKQLSLSDIQDELRSAKTRKKEFLEQIERVIPWEDWVKLIQPHYYAGERGNKPYDLELMLRIYVLQNLYDLAVDATVFAPQGTLSGNYVSIHLVVIDSRAFSIFCNISSSNQVPSGDTLGRFRNILIEANLQEELFQQVVSVLEQRGLILKKGTIVDSSLISAPSSTKNKEKQRDPDAHSTKKGNTWTFGYKMSIGVEKKTGLVHSNVTTAANQSDISLVPELLTGEELEVYGDAGYLGAEKREEAITHSSNGDKINYQINRRPSQSKNNRAQIRRIERNKSSVRSKVEHVFGVIKKQLKFRKTRYRGLPKQIAKVNMMCALCNLIMADSPSRMAV